MGAIWLYFGEGRKYRYAGVPLPGLDALAQTGEGGWMPARHPPPDFIGCEQAVPSILVRVNGEWFLLVRRECDKDES